MYNPSQPPRREKSYIPTDFDSMVVSVASPDQILAWSYGEVTKPETINYRTQKPERDGLFCERIFGPTKNWECYCGKYKKLRYKNIVCDKCGVEVTRSSVRRERMGHIKLAVPVTHIWFLRSTPSRIGLLLDLPVKTLEQVVYFASYIIKDVDEGAKETAVKQLIAEFKAHQKKVKEKYQESLSKLEKIHDDSKQWKKERDTLQAEMTKELEQLDTSFEAAKDDLKSIQYLNVISELKYRNLSMKFGQLFKAGIGAEALREIIEDIDLEEMRQQLEKDLDTASAQKQKKMVKRLKLVSSLAKAGIQAEWMVLTVIPIIPPDFRPMVQLDGGRFAASDLNDLYRRIINRNNRLKRLLEIGAPEVICRNEKRMLQEAIDALINNSARAGRAVVRTGSTRLQLKSLSDMLKGKQGRFRQNLLGKRVDYSGRSVIVVGPRLRLDQCGLPKKMALELFKPFVIGQLIKREIAHNVKNAEKLIERGRPEVWDVLEEVTHDHVVLLNRAPTLHRMGIQAFYPVLIEGKAIQIHPLVCAAFNADFDGDQMAVHVPLSSNAQWEGKNVMLSSKNLLKPSSGEPITNPTQDMVLGCYYLTHIDDDAKLKPIIAGDINEAVMAYRKGYLRLQDRIRARVQGEIIETSVGRMIFNSFLPIEMQFKNVEMNKDTLASVVTEAYELYGCDKTAELCDEIKRIGFKFATKSGLSLSAFDLTIPPGKEKVLNEASEVVNQLNTYYRKGLLTDNERYVQIVKTWARVKNVVTDQVLHAMDPKGTVHTMVNSGARGNWSQVTQLAGMKGLVANPAGRTIELPIQSNFREGFTVLEYFIATHGGRKGKSDTALKTAGAGYLTRRLVDAVQDVVVREEDCGSIIPIMISMEESEAAGVSLSSRIYGRILAEPVAHPRTGEVLAERGEEVGNDHVAKFEAAEVTKVWVRSVLTCEARNGACVKCYGRDMANNKIVLLGTAVGIIAAQSIGEPGTQLTMRTFHQGGVAEGKDITQGLPRVEELFEARPPKTEAFMSEINGEVGVSRESGKMVITVTSDEIGREEYFVEDGFEIVVKDGKKIKPKTILAKRGRKMLKSIDAGTVEIDGHKITVIHPGKMKKEYTVSTRDTLLVSNGDRVVGGQPLTEGHLNLGKLVQATNILTAQQYIISEVQKIYAAQGQTINDKHIEVIVRQMFSRCRINEPGDSTYLPGQITDFLAAFDMNEKLEKEKQKGVKIERLLLGLTRVSLTTDSWLSAASFQETIRVLVEAAVTKRVDYLTGLKENVIIGKLIHAGGVFRGQRMPDDLDYDPREEEEKEIEGMLHKPITEAVAEPVPAEQK